MIPREMGDLQSAYIPQSIDRGIPEEYFHLPALAELTGVQNDAKLTAGTDSTSRFLVLPGALYLSFEV
jgi:hypothetical protein